MTLDLTRVATLARELREHDAGIPGGEWKPKVNGNHQGGSLTEWEWDSWDIETSLPCDSPDDESIQFIAEIGDVKCSGTKEIAEALCHYRNHARELADLLDAARGEIERLTRLAPLCKGCGSGNGTRSGCPYCCIVALQESLSEIDYVCGEPNEYHCSLYDADLDHKRVVERARTALANPAPAGERGVT
jgi:hypothetical protein